MELGHGNWGVDLTWLSADSSLIWVSRNHSAGSQMICVSLCMFFGRNGHLVAGVTHVAQLQLIVERKRRVLMMQMSYYEGRLISSRNCFITET